MPSQRVAAIDCGTNSIRLLISDVDGGSKTDLVREMRIVRLGEGVDQTGRLSQTAIDRTLDATREYAALIAEYGATSARFCATSAMRDAANGAELSQAVSEVLGVNPEILSGHEEARASFVGATRALGGGRTLVVDIGGGSTELVVGQGDDVEWSVSLDIGSVRLTERFLASDPATPEQIAACRDHIDQVLEPHLENVRGIQAWVGVAGTITTVAAHALQLPEYDSAAIDGARLPVGVVDQACQLLLDMTVAQRRELGFMHPGRADVIGAGAVIVQRLIELLPLDTHDLVVSERDILDGIAWGMA